ncbi:MAG: class I SAM-dependent methyltransferase [Bacteroidales bacterium]|nr:class I SAM-dependent methyltransferase [Bacteroidales bacterium]
MPAKQQIEHLFNAIAPSYDKLNHIMSFGIDRSWRRKAVRAIADQPDVQRVLDVATGTGDFAIAIAEKLPKGSEIVGIDLSEQMLGVGRQKVLGKAGLHLMQHTGNVRKKSSVADVGIAGASEKPDYSNTRVNIVLHQGDVEQLAFADGSFDRVSVAFGIRNFEHLKQGLSEMSRVLRSGGKLVILELSYPDNPFFFWCYKLYALHFLPFIGGLISGQKEAYRYLPKSILAFPKEDKMMPLLHSVGFQNVEYQKFTFGSCVMYMAEK